MTQRLVLLFALIFSANAFAQLSSPDARTQTVPGTGAGQSLDIPVPEPDAPARHPAHDRVRDPGAASRELDTLRQQRLEHSTQRFRPALPSRRDDSSASARAERRLQNLRAPGRLDRGTGRPGF